MLIREKKHGLVKSAVLAMLFLILLAGNIRTVNAEPTVDGPETITGLEDYTEAYGWEPNDKEQRVQVESNRRSRSAKSTREVVYLSVFVTFQDTPTKLNNPDIIEAAELLLNTGGEVTNTGGTYTVPSLKQSVEQVTYGKLTTTSHIFPRESAGSSKVVSYVAPRPRRYYLKQSGTNPDGYTSAQQNNREAELITGAINAMNQQVGAAGITEAQLDSDNDGFVDAISFFIGGGQGGVVWRDLLWSHKIDALAAPLPADPQILGKSISAWNLINVNETSNSDLGGAVGEVFSKNRPAYAVIAHEYLHTLGLPDLYRGDNSGDPVGTYDVMAASTVGFPQGILAAMAEERGWHNPLPEVNSSGRVTLKKKAYTDPDEKVAVKIRSPYSNNEFFVAEFYTRNKLEKYLGDLNSTGRYSNSDGLLISRMKTDEYNGNMGKAPGTDMLYVFRPGELRPNEGKGSIASAALNMAKNRTRLGKASSSGGFDNETIFLSDGTNSGIVIELVSETTNEITFDVTIPQVQGTGTEKDPYLISEPSDFKLIRNLPEKYYKITKDIDFSGVTDFTPIKALGSDYKAGVLDGNGKTIQNLTIDNSSTDSTGFFGNINMLGIVKDLSFENLNVTGHGVQVGGVAASISGTAENVTIKSGSIANTATVADFPLNEVVTGGMVGYLRSTGKIINSYSSANVTANVYAGGLAGESQNGALTNSYANGNVRAGTKGGAIGLFRARNSSYNTETKRTYYDKKATSTAVGIGAEDGNVTIPKESGIFGVTAPDQIALDLDGVNEKELELTFDPTSGAAADPLEISVASDAIATVNSSNKIVGVSAGTTKATAKFLVGPHKMGLVTEVVVTGSTKPIPAAGDFNVDLSSKTYNKTAQGVSVTAAAGVTGLGAISVKYKNGSDPAAANIPVYVGTYEVFVDVAEGSNYQAATDILLGTYTIDPISIANAAVSIAPIQKDSVTQLTGQTLAVQGTNFIQGDTVNAVNCTITFPSTATEGTFSDAAVTIGGLDNKNYSIADNRLDNQSYRVEGITLNEILITSAPNKTTYFEGESFDRTGMVAEGIWSDGTQTDVSNQVTITPSGALGVGDAKVTITYGGQSTDQAITVNKVLPVRLEITVPPVKIKYTEGEVFDGSGMELTLVYNNGSTEVVTKDYQVTGDALSLGTTEVEFTYEKDGQVFRVSQPITVSEKPGQPDKPTPPEDPEQPTPPDKPDKPTPPEKPEDPGQQDPPKGEFTQEKIEHNETGITIEGSFTSEAQLRIELLDQEADVPEAIKKELGNKIIIGSYDVSLIKGTYQGRLILHFPVDSSYNGTQVTVKHLRKDGSIETFDKTVVKGFVTVEVDELSPFAIAVNKKLDPLEKPKPQADKKPVKDTANKSAAKTSDTTPVAGMYLLALASLAGIGYFIKRKRAEP